MWFLNLIHSKVVANAFVSLIDCRWIGRSREVRLTTSPRIVVGHANGRKETARFADIRKKIDEREDEEKEAKSFHSS